MTSRKNQSSSAAESSTDMTEVAQNSLSNNGVDQGVTSVDNSMARLTVNNHSDRSSGPRSTRPTERPRAPRHHPRLSPRDGLGLSRQNSRSTAPPGPTLFGYITNTLQHAQTGPSNVGPNRHVPGPSNPEPGRLVVPPPHILEMMAAEIDRSRQTSEQSYHGMPNSIESIHQAQQQTPMLQDFLNSISFLHPQVMFPHNGRIDRRIEPHDVDQMSYEEMLALGDEIGSVRSGLREETIMANMRQRTYERNTSGPSASTETCPICREAYVNGESIGTLDCNHEFHTGCIKQWLMIKNECPICKMKGLDG